MGQLSLPYIATGKIIALTRQIFVGKVMSLLFSMLSRSAIAFLPRSIFFFFFNFMAAVTICSDFGTQENKACHCFHWFTSIFHEVMEWNAMILVFECWVLSQLFLSHIKFWLRLWSRDLQGYEIHWGYQKLYALETVGLREYWNFLLNVPELGVLSFKIWNIHWNNDYFMLLSIL